MHPKGALAVEALEDEPFSAEQDRAHAFLEGHVELDAALCREEGVLLEDPVLAAMEVDRGDLPRHPAREGDDAGASVRGELRDEERLPREDAFQALHEAAA